MKNRERVVVDTNVLVSRLLVAGSTPARAVRMAVDQGQLLLSDAMLEEVVRVLLKPKFDPYVTMEERQEFLRMLSRVAVRVPVTYRVQACRDEKDNMVLELAVNGRADVVISGDRDLLEMGSYQGIAIVTPAEYLTKQPG